MFHLIVLANAHGRRIAYYFNNNNLHEFIRRKEQLLRIPNDLLIDCSIHVLKDSSCKNFKDIQQMDPYFDNVHEIASLNKFIEILKK